MSAQRLRDVASTLREVAEGASPAPWEQFKYPHAGRSGALELSGVRSVPIEATGEFDSEVSESIDETDARYIATMHPPVALALADWLDVVAIRASRVIETMRSPTVGDAVARENCLGYIEALAVADAIHGATP